MSRCEHGPRQHAVYDGEECAFALICRLGKGWRGEDHGTEQNPAGDARHRDRAARGPRARSTPPWQFPQQHGLKRQSQ